jgi:hypothetical protein
VPCSGQIDEWVKFYLEYTHCIELSMIEKMQIKQILHSLSLLTSDDKEKEDGPV